MSRSERGSAKTARRGNDGRLPKNLALVVAAIDDLKGMDPLVLDVREVASFTDHMVLCTGSSDRHVQALVDGIKEKLRGAEVTPLHTEGYEQATWVLVDFVDFLVNVFTPDSRAFYQLERVWRDAPVLVGERDEPVAEGAEPAATDESGADAAGGEPGSAAESSDAAPAAAKKAPDPEAAADDAADG